MGTSIRVQISAGWSGTSSGDGSIVLGRGSLEFGKPVEFGGKPGRTDPEQMLLASVASCWMITFASMAERRGLPPMQIEMAAEGEIVKTDYGAKIAAFVLRPLVTVSGELRDKVDTILQLADHVEKYCLVGKAISRDVRISVLPEVLVSPSEDNSKTNRRKTAAAQVAIAEGI